jgi:general stress protein YciG
MTERLELDRLVDRVAGQVRRRRLEYYGLRGAFYGAVLALVPLLAKGIIGQLAPVAALALVVAGGLVGIGVGLILRVPRGDVARLADRAFGLEDRVATALEWTGREDRTPLVEALLADTRRRLEQVHYRRIIPRLFPREARLLPLPLVAAAALAYSPAVPLPSGRLPYFSSGADEEPTPERAGPLQTDQAARALKRDPLRTTGLQERDFAQRGGGGATTQSGDLSAIFKDTKLTGARPDFNSFLKKGDERLKMLEQIDRLPDLQSDFTQSPYKMMFQRSKALRSGLRPDQMSPQKLRELLEEMERMGRKGGNWSSDAFEGMEALDGGQPDKALEAMQKALDKMRAMEEGRKGGRTLRGGREKDRGSGTGRERGQGGPEDQDFGEGEGLLPGKGRSPSAKGDPSARLRATPYDAGVEGETRRGRKEGFDTNMVGRGANVPSRLQYLGLVGQYRKMMEDAIAREQVPRDYQAQIKDYFQALDER